MPVSPLRASSSNVGSPNLSLPDLEAIGYRASTMEEKICRHSCRAYPDSKIASKRFPIQWPRMMRKSRISNKWLAALQPVLPHWKGMQQPSPVDPAQQDLGICLDRVPAPQPLGPLGPMDQGHLMTVEIRGVDFDTFSSPEH